MKFSRNTRGIEIKLKIKERYSVAKIAKTVDKSRKKNLHVYDDEFTKRYR